MKSEGKKGESDDKVVCRWWESHKYTKWEDLSHETNKRNQPAILIG